MTESKPKSGIATIKEVLDEDEDYLRASLRGYVHEVPESEMTSAPGASKSACASTRAGYRSAYCKPTPVTRGALSARVEENIEEMSGLYSLPRAHHKHLKSTNMLERFNREIKQRTRSVRIFPNEESCLRLVRWRSRSTRAGWRPPAA